TAIRPSALSSALLTMRPWRARTRIRLPARLWRPPGTFSLALAPRRGLGTQTFRALTAAGQLEVVRRGTGRAGAGGGEAVVGVAAGNGPGSVSPGTVGVAIAGAFGTLILNADGSYNYVHVVGG